MIGPASISGTGAWFRPAKPDTEGRLRIFCLPHAGGGTAMFYGWQRRVSDDLEVMAARLPGREARLLDPCFTNVSDLVSALASAIEPLIRSAYAVFGHSMGALLGFELIREIRRLGFKEPVRFFVSGAPAPQIPLPDGPTRHLTDIEFVNEVVRRYGAISGSVLENAELLKLVLPYLRADFELIESYVYQEAPPLGCPISCFGGSDDPRTNAGQLQAWRVHTASEFSVRVFPGGHFFFQKNADWLPFSIADDLASDAFKGRW